MYGRVCVVALLSFLLLAPSGTAQVPDLDLFPTHEEVMGRVAAVADDPWITVTSIGSTHENRSIVLAIATDPDSGVPMEDRVVTLLLTQQHGNEPAGTPAALELLEEIAARGPASEALGNQILLVQPMGNPDGATAQQRANAQDVDLNRDHVHLEQPEAEAVHRLFQEWDIHVGVDHHEYSGLGTGYPSPVRLYDHDITTLFPRHGNVRAPTMAAAEALMYDGMWPAAEEAGYSINEYGEQTVAGVPVEHAAGGPDPGILRNNFGLNNIAGILVESFVPLGAPNPLIDAERRTDVHRVMMHATLDFVSANAQTFIDAKRESERLNLEEPMTEYVEAWPDDPVPVPVADSPRTPRAGPLAPAYATSESLDPLMAKHGLPAGVAAQEGHVYSLLDARAGLVAAILHPESSRQVPGSVTALDAAPTLDASDAAEGASADTPGVPVAGTALAVLAGLFVARRSRNE